MSTPGNDTLPSPPSRLGIIHLLGWMAGVAIVLGFYRNFTDWSEFEEGEIEPTRWLQLALSLAYGASLASLAMLLRRRIAGGPSFPSQPGHWLLVLAGLGFLLVGAAEVASSIMQIAGWISDGRGPRFYAQLTTIWYVVFVGGVLSLVVFWRAMGVWRWLAVACTLLGLCNGTAHLLAELVFYSSLAARIPFSAGNWPYFLAMWSRAYGMGLCLLALSASAFLDRRPRDWLHYAGVAAAGFLGIVEVVQIVLSLLHYG